jgi:hypothetical protein
VTVAVSDSPEAQPCSARRRVKLQCQMTFPISNRGGRRKAVEKDGERGDFVFRLSICVERHGASKMMDMEKTTQCWPDANAGGLYKWWKRNLWLCVGPVRAGSWFLAAA